MTGLEATIEVTALALIFSTVIGLIGGLLLLYGPLPLRILVRLYVDFIRGMPVLVLLFAVYYVPSAFGYSLDAFSASVVALSFFAGAHVSELVRGAIGSLPDAQINAAKVIGLTRWQRFRLVVVPLSLPRMLPPWINTGVEILKGSSLASLIGVTEFLYSTQAAAGTSFNPLPLYMFAAVVYFIFSFGLSRGGLYLEGRLRYRE